MKEFSQVSQFGDQHLSELEIWRLSAFQRSLPPEQDDESRDSMQEHLSRCSDCQSRLKHAVALQTRLASLCATTDSTRSQHCLDESKWLNFAAGIMTPTESQEMIEHASNCELCASRLKEAVATLTDDLSVAEKEIISRLKSSRPDWQAGLAERLATDSEALGQNKVPGKTSSTSFDNHPFERRISRVPRLAWAVGAAAILALAVWISLKQFADPSVDNLLASAYTENRTMELRMRGAKFAPFRTERGLPGSTLDSPQALLDANSLIARKLRTSPDNALWLDAKGRAELLRGEYKEAIKTLQKAQDSSPDSAEILADLAIGYFQRAETEDRPLDYGLAMDFMSKALKRNPNDPILLFNRAIVAERAFQFTQASEDWELFLRLDPRSDWAAEARSRLEKLRQKLHTYEQNSTQPLWTAAQLANTKTNEDTKQAELDRRIEEYLHLALTSWLEDRSEITSASSHQDQRSPEKLALDELATTMYQRHRDSWLREFTAAAPSPHFRAAQMNLRSAVIAADRGDFRSAADRSSIAATLFRRSANQAGQLRARFERVYALQLSNNSRSCVAEAHHLSADLKNTKYSWLKIQVMTELAICLNMAGDIANAIVLAERASVVAQKTNYKSLELRTTAMAAAFETDIGNHSEAWRLVQTSLRRFWAEPSPPMRGYNLYVVLDELADALQLHDFRLAVWKQAINLIASDQDILLRAIAHLRLADAALKAKAPALAETAFNEGTFLLGSLPQDETVQNNEIEASIWFARFEMSNGALESALNRLTQHLGTVERLSTRYVTIDFYRTLGELQMKRGSLADAKRSLDLAIGSAENALRSLGSQDDRQKWNSETSDAYRALTALMIRNGDAARALGIWEWYRGAIVRKSGTTSNDFLTPIENLQRRAARQNESLIVYASLPEGLAVWIVNEHGIHFRSIAVDPMTLTSLIRRFVAICSDPSSDISTIQFVGGKLYQILVEPIADEISPNQQTIIEADAPISLLPMQALVDHSGHYFGETHSITWSQGVYFSDQLPPSVPFTSASHVLVVADPASSGDSMVPPLMSARHEGERVGSLFSNSLLLSGRKATWANVTEHLSQSSVFHFAGHAVANQTESGLLLSPDLGQPINPSLLNQHSLPRSSLIRTRLAVLAACSSQNGTDGTAFDPDALAMVFMKSGVPHVVASRWSVDSGATAIQMESFYRKLLAGTAIADSLRFSAAELRSQPETRHPYYWAAFDAFGKT